MRMYDVIKKKRDGEALSAEEIRAFIEGYSKGEIPDYQAAALCMAIFFRGMSDEETTELTLAVRDSGERLDTSRIKGLRVDKHSTGGVGDKTSLVVAPIVASLGLTVAKMSGRGLGHTGGTIDKLEAIPGFCTGLAVSEFENIVNETGIAIVGQSATLAPADKMLYALRDVTATVDSMPLIASSIMGKKLAADDDCIVLDVKTGSGSFMKELEDSRTLAKLMVAIGKRAGKRISALITDMDRPLGYAVGNSLEVVEAIEALQGKGPEDLVELSLALASQILFLADKGTLEECRALAEDAITSGKALDTFAKMVKAQGGDPEYIYHPEKFATAPYSREVKVTQSGYIASVDTEKYGLASLLLGAGRNTKEDAIDLTAGYMIQKKTGDYVNAGDTLAVLYTSNASLLDAAERTLLNATTITAEAPEKRPLIFEVI
ncbi:MAG: pyrimidine-nucleoside phosphorylase [Clostridia bacterium]|nr:pyrimidine-nucleoside phosphorylase [Clostridia bacterium]